MRILVIEDDDSLRAAVRRALILAGYEGLVAVDGQEGLLQSRTTQPDAIILDLGLPGIDGMEVCRQLRQDGDRTPILMLTARDAVEDRVDGLEAGADDYIVKPYDVRELRARLRAIMRRHVDGADGRSLHFENLELDAGAHAARIAGRTVNLAVSSATPSSARAAARRERGLSSISSPPSSTTPPSGSAEPCST